jgi:hypothetical protein
MNQNTCIYCGENFVGKRSDAKFCTSTCKAKYWEEKKANGQVDTALKLSDGLRGIVGDKALVVKKPKEPEFYTKEIQVETSAYKFGKEQFTQIQTSIRRLETQKKDLIVQAKQIAERNGELYYFTGATVGACIADKHYKDTDKILLGTGLGLAAGFIADKLFQGDREKNKQKEIAELSRRVQGIDVYLTSIRKTSNELGSILTRIPQYEKKLIKCPAFSIGSLYPCSKEIPARPVNPQAIAVPQYEKKMPVILPSPAKSEKVVSSQELHNMDYTALDFQGKWNMLFGYPSVNFHCVLTGMSGEGKSTFAIQFASYLAENFGRVLYISGEEGFSKTFKDKFINNNAIANDLYIADLRSFEGIIKEIAPDTYHFIFIDSLDNMRIDAEKMKQLRERYKDSALITISQSTKDGKMRGSYEIVHDCDMAIKVEGGIATTTKNRFKEKGMKMPVFS